MGGSTIKALLESKENISITLNLQDLRIVVREMVETIEPNELEEEFYDTVEACKVLKIERHTLKRYVDRGLIPCCKVLKKNLYKKNEVIALIKVLDK